MSDSTGEGDPKVTEQFEGFRSAPYQDSGGTWTIGYGSTRDLMGHAVTPATKPINKVIGETMLRRDLSAAFTTVRNDVKVPLTPEESGALTDFVYNVGAGAFATSTLLRKLNGGDYDGAAAELDKWDHAGGRVLSGLLRRREAETAEFESGSDFTTSA